MALKQHTDSGSDDSPCSAWRDPQTDPPTKTGKILVWLREYGPAIVNVEERWMSYWDGFDETDMTDPDEWQAWREICPPNVEFIRAANDL